ncbi:siderophore-interacting protein [Microbacterium sediminicola]|uniref:Siderophore-interacting protein n=1 Tax=Microbacterium sediminicola TaxID=415210 RepID=A0ABP4UHW0_9MICO
MARAGALVKPQIQDLIHLRVLRTERVSPHWQRITLGGAEIEKFRPLGYDQWFRIFLPLGGDDGLDRIPAKANKLFGYLTYLRIPDGVRPVMRNYTVRAYRAAGPSGGPEIDVDFVLHGSVADGTAGPASRWAETCEVGDSVVIIDEGLGFNPARGVERVLLVADESGLPALAGVCASLPDSAIGTALIEVADPADALEFDHPAGVEVRWVVRAARAHPGTAVLAALAESPPSLVDIHAFIVGEQSLPTAARRWLVERGVDKNAISFIGYWRVGSASPTPKSQRPEASRSVAAEDGDRS